MQRIALSLFLLVVCSSLAFAQNTETGGSGTMEELVRKCEGKAGSSRDATEKLIEDIMGTGQCIGFFSGILDANALAESVLGKPLFCLPKIGISVDQAQKIYLKYAKDHPEELHQSARATVAVVLMQAFPCEGRSR
jgi:hypothetical protein